MIWKPNHGIEPNTKSYCTYISLTKKGNIWKESRITSLLIKSELASIPPFCIRYRHVGRELLTMDNRPQGDVEPGKNRRQIKKSIPTLNNQRTNSITVTGQLITTTQMNNLSRRILISNLAQVCRKILKYYNYKPMNLQCISVTHFKVHWLYVLVVFHLSISHFSIYLFILKGGTRLTQ